MTLFFGLEAQHHACEFLTCFALQPVNGELSITSPYLEVGFSLPLPTGDDRTPMSSQLASILEFNSKFRSAPVDHQPETSLPQSRVE